jgi:ABC-type sugar transport system substrate-binding protein
MELFICYKQGDVDAFVAGLCKFLEHQLDDANAVHIDTKFSGGPNWFEQRDQWISKSDVLIVVAGPTWYARGVGRTPLGDLHDEVTHEIVTASNRGATIFPILVNRKQFEQNAGETLPPLLRSVLKDPQWSFADVTFNPDCTEAKLLHDLLAIREQRRPKPVVLISSTLSFFVNEDSPEGLSYFTSLVTSIAQQMHSNGHDLALKVPVYHSGPDAEELTANNQRVLLRDAVKSLAQYSGLIIAPFNTESLCDDLVNLRLNHPSFPVITVDKDYSPNDKRFKAQKVPPPPSSICDGRHGGRLAADAVLEYLVQADISKPNVVILQGLEGSLPRVKGFRRRIREYNAKVVADRRIHLAISRPLAFRQGPAAKEASEYLRSSDWTALNDHTFGASDPPKRSDSVDAFFCCNDEMALGVRDELDRIYDKEKRLALSIVVGFDGIASVKKRIRDRDLWLINTVDVRLSHQILELVRLFERPSNGRDKTVKATKGWLVARIKAEQECSDKDLSQRTHVDYILGERKSARERYGPIEVR